MCRLWCCVFFENRTEWWLVSKREVADNSLMSSWISSIVQLCRDKSAQCLMAALFVIDQILKNYILRIKSSDFDLSIAMQHKRAYIDLYG